MLKPASSSLDNVQTKGVGFAPILGHYFERCGIEKIINEHVELDPRRKELTHGQACVAMITGILFQCWQLYKLSKFASETDVLNVIFPAIEAKEYFDDRLGDTLDAIFAYGIGNLELCITEIMIEEFSIKNDICHNDTTTASVYGDCGNNKTKESIKISFGHSKKHRNDLKQLVWSLSVSGDSGFPLFQKAYNGNTADVNTYVEQWINLIDLLGHDDVLFVGDKKLACKENMATIHENDGYFLAPLPRYETYNSALDDALDNHESEILIPYKGRFNRGFEAPLTIQLEDDDDDDDDKNRDHTYRMIILYDHGLFARKSGTLQNRIEKTEEEFENLNQRLNKYRLKKHEEIDKALSLYSEKTP